MCSAKHIQILNLCAFVGNLLYSEKKYEIDILLLWLSQINHFISDCRFTIIAFQDSVLKLMFSDIIKVNYMNETLFVNPNCLQIAHNKWALFCFKCKTKTTKRILKVIASTKVPKGFIFCNSDTLYNIKHPFNFTPYLASSCVKFKILKVLDNYKHQQASKLVTSILQRPSHVPTILCDKSFKNFIKSPKLMHFDDVISVDLLQFGVEKVFGYIYFKIINVEGPANDYVPDIEHSFIVSQKTVIYGEMCSYNYLPSVEWLLLDSKKLASTVPILPFGLEKYYCKLFKWIQPFLISPTHGLKPIFILSGIDNSSINIIIEALSKKLGVYYWDADCNNIISSSLSQINSNIKTILKNATSKSPCILHLKRFELLSLDSDGVDSVQLCESLRTHFENFTSSFPVIIIASCSNIDSLQREFIRLFLEHMHVELPTEKERMLMSLWLSKLHNVNLDQNTMEFLISETKTYGFTKLKNLLCLAEKERLLCKDEVLSVSHFTTVLGKMSSTGRLPSTVEWADVGGVELIKKEVVSSLISSRLLGSKEGLNSTRRTGILLYGPPGTGKTLLARAVASQSMRAFVPVNGPDLLNMYVGQSEANVREVFRRAREASPCIMFFDELDSIAPNRGNKSDSGGVMDRVVSTLLSEMDNLDNNGDVFILGATNRPDLLDPALLRPGRFDKMLYIGPCQDEDSKLKVLKALSRKFVLDKVSLEEVVKMLPMEVTGATVYAVCSTAWLSAARQQIREGQIKPGIKVVVQMRHFEEAIRELS